MREKILIVEDEEKMARMLELELSHEGYEVFKRSDGTSGLDAALNGDFDLLLLDIMLPGLSGIELLRRLRKEKNTPVILLTARDEVVDKVLGLDSGADDYVTKPFMTEELLARVRAALRKAAAPRTDSSNTDNLVFTTGRLTLDALKYRVSYDGQEIRLTPKEFELLRCLIENKGRVLTKDMLLDKVWGYDYFGETNAVDVYIHFLRNKIDEAYGVKLITTVRGVGYRIEE
jgi:DNA-binding response OmpR family regulator